MEAEHLDACPQVGEPAVGDPPPAVRAQAAVDEVEVVEQRGGRRIAGRALGERLAEALPDERELAPVGLAGVLRADPGRVAGKLGLVAGDRVRQLGQDRDERARDADELGETAHLCTVVRERQLAGAVERGRDRLRPGGGVAVLVAADPRPEAERRPDAGQPAPQLAGQVGRLLEQALLEEPQSVADLVDDARSQGSHLVGLPERGHLLGDRVADPVAPGRGEIGVVELVQQATQT